MKPLVIIGAGGHARVLLDIALICDYEILGFTLPEKSEVRDCFGYPVIGTDDEVLKSSSKDFLLVNALGSIGSLERRYEVFRRFHQKGFCFATLIHPSATVAHGVNLGEGVQIMAGSVIQPGCSIGVDSIVNTGCLIDHDCRIGNHVHLAPGVTISGSVGVGDCTHVGTAASVIQGVNIGEWSLVGAGSLVLRDINDRQMVVGVPAKVTKNMRDWKKILVSPEENIRTVIEVIDRESIQIALVVDENRHLLGTVTDGDIRRAILGESSLKDKIFTIMNSKPITLSEKNPKNKVLQIMREKSVHQLPVLDSQGRVIGLELLENLLL